MSYDLATGYSLAIFGRLRQAKRELEQAKQRLEKWQKSIQADPAQVAQGRVAACATSALSDFWWQTVRQDLTPLAMTPRWPQWANPFNLP